MDSRSVHINPLQRGFPAPGRVATKGGEGQFNDILQGFVRGLEKSDVKFSAHAMDRISRRGIVLERGMESRLLSGMDSLKSKGAKDGLIIMDDNRFVVSVENRTVITAMTKREQDVYTNIDSVAFV